ncbi:MAG: ExsB family protein [Candidatus Atribacteria bacterium]|nr:ExsB family protein [Candidatus Atribacteria bacterium]MCD6349907.1 ExsB family protein [Candidatus Atribacteria bacterium]
MMLDRENFSLSGLFRSLKEELKGVASSFEKAVVAFSGGADSTLALFIAICALGRDRVIACTVDWGEYLPPRARKNVELLTREFGVEQVWIDGEKDIVSVARGGPACNRCTRKAKLGRIKSHFGEKALIIGGFNRSDSWGNRGIKFFDNTFSPLFHLDKAVILRLARFLGIPVLRVGENEQREGCFLKHLLKPLASDFQGDAVVKSNSCLLNTLEDFGFRARIANVKIIGTLRKNVALVNLLPSPPPALREVLDTRLGAIPEVDEVFWVEKPLTLVIRANPGQYNNPEALYWIERGKLQPDFVVPIGVRWLPSTNRRLNTFQVVDFEERRLSYEQQPAEATFSIFL